MNSTNTGGPAFPSEGRVSTDYGILYDGMTLRDYFAAKAMQALTMQGQKHLKTIAEDAYVMADAMLKAREA